MKEPLIGIEKLGGNKVWIPNADGGYTPIDPKLVVTNTGGNQIIDPRIFVNHTGEIVYPVSLNLPNNTGGDQISGINLKPNFLPGQEINVGDWKDNVLLSKLPVPEPRKSTVNGETYTSNPKHTLGQGKRSNPNAGIEPRNSFELFEGSVQIDKQRFKIDNEGNIHRFMDSKTSDGWHWAGSTSDKRNPLQLTNKQKAELKKLYPQQKKNPNLK